VEDGQDEQHEEHTGQHAHRNRDAHREAAGGAAFGGLADDRMTWRFAPPDGAGGLAS
jgi:hypothetical protein